MTNEEFDEILERTNAVVCSREWYERAIKALEQEPCEDCVSRQAVLARINDWWGITSTSGEPSICDYIRELPPVAPTQEWIPVSERLPKEFEFVNCTCHSLIDDREDWVVETVYIPQPSDSPYSDWGNIPMLNSGDCEVVAWVHRDIPKPYKAEMESEE